MSKFHESVRELLEDVQNFLMILNKEILSMEALSRKESLLTKLTVLQQDYPQLTIISKSLSSNRYGSNGDILSSPNPPSSPPPYVDMQGNRNTTGTNEPVDEDYEVCNNDKNYIPKENLPESKSMNDTEEVSMEEEKETPAVVASDLVKSEKCGYLEKKGKERLGGLLNPFQRRWCAIKDGILYYFERPTDRRQKGEIPLAGYRVNPAPTATKDVNKRDLCFELTCPGRKTYQFMALTPKDVKQWVAAIERNNKMSHNANSLEISTANEFQRDSSTLGSVESDEDNIYEMVDETGNQTKFPKGANDAENEPLYVEGESCDQNDLYTDAESTTNEWENFNPQDWYVGLWDCKGDDKNELDFLRGDLIHIISKEYDSCAWWVGLLKGKVGLVPKSYLMEAYEAI
ncbi:src kinase-associated phosphoprotein 2-B-like isoform X2 [Centruroides sculpturatus]|uniref:src kinase-associated phosphoprotein 2-B-like isoform X2 n=1 Tax=Centruroides sculpturatus TaxID=218467 RepID=UPI000C6DB31F|nr:src kinase-associated phosphoprotein 2-B-like isoform X2 [Centruroides sculpturatus]